MKKSFTLIELLVVVVIIAVLAAIVAPNVFRAIEKSKIARTLADVVAIDAAMMCYRADTGVWPPDFDSIHPNRLINGLLDNDDGTGNPVFGWDGPYVETYKAHPWGGNYSFHCGFAPAWGGGWCCTVYLDDDRPWTGPVHDDNSGKVPPETMLKIDQTGDDGDLTTGNIREFPATPGELAFRIAQL